VKPNIEIIDIFQSQDSRILGAHVTKGKINLDIVDIYVPSDTETRKQFLSQMPFLGERYQVATGDFNTYPLIMDHSAGKSRPRMEWSNVEQKLAPLVDSVRLMKPKEKFFTHHQINNQGTRTSTRIDHIFIHPELVNKAKKVTVQHCPFSDHDLVILTLEWGSDKRQQTRIHEETARLPQLRTILGNKPELGTNHYEWDIIKFETFSRAKALEIQRSRDQRSKLNRLQAAWRQTMALNPSDFRTNRLQHLEEELNQWYSSRAQIVQLKSRVKWLEKGERCTAYFFKRYRKKKDQADISCIKPEPFNETWEAVNHFYQNLYQGCSADNRTAIDTFLDFDLPKLTQEDALEISQPITEDEIQEAIKHTKAQSALGPDGIPYAWYRANLDLLATPLATLFNQVLEKGSVPPSWRKTYIKLIPKGSQSLEQVSNWRPIALINCDAKLFSRVLTNRLRKHMTSLISPAQEGFITNRWIANAAFDIMTTQEHLSKQQNPTALLFLDQQKAYDRVNHQYLKAVLKKFAFPDTIQAAIAAIYSNNTARILGPSGPWQPININSGVRQGDPLSPFLFNISIEPVVRQLQQKLQGLPLSNSTFRLQLFCG
jgi:endonuclease/exonuclease/phosphatase family metal-dependent hydrolase